VRRRRRPAAVLPLIALVAGVAWFAWRFIHGESGADLERRARASDAKVETASDARPPAGERDLAARSAEASPAPTAASDVAIEPTPDHGVPVVVVACGSGEPQPFALVTRIEPPWDERADARSHRDANWLLDHLGRRFRADARGLVRIPPSAGRLDLFARVGALAGYAQLAPGEVKARDDVPPKRIEVAPLADLRVRVVDPGGSPVAGVPLEVVGDGGGQVIPWTPGACESMAPDGIAEVHGASLLIDDDVKPDGLLVYVSLPLRHPVSLRLARAELDGTPRTLVVPATGSVELVLVDEHGSVPAIDDSRSVLLLRAPRRGSMTKEEHALQIGTDAEVTFRSGRALLPFVELGDWIEADLDFGAHGCGFVQAPGPTVAGATVRVEVPILPNSETVVIRGRVVDAEGKAIAERRLGVNYEMRSATWSVGGGGGQTTSADGSFEVALRKGVMLPPPVWSSMKLALVIERPAGGREFQHELELDGEFARHGGDLGTVALERAPLLASGVVVDESDAPVEHVRVHLVQTRAADPRYRAPPNWPDFSASREEFTARSGADGSFTIVGDPGRGTFGLAVDDDRYLSPPPTPFEPGATDLRLVVARPAALLAHVLVDPGVPPGFVMGTIRVPRDGDASHDVTQWLCSDERGNLLFEHLPPRPAQVKVWAGGFGAPKQLIAHVDEIPLTAGERTIDPRLQTIDLRGRFQAIHLVVVDPDGQPIRNVVVRPNPDASDDGDANGSNESRELDSGVEDVVTTGALPPIEVEAEGFRSQRAELTRPETRITLRRGLEVVVELDPSLPALPESCFYSISLARGDFSESIDSDSARPLAPGSERSFRVDRPGDCGVQLALARYIDRRSFGINELKSGRTRIQVEDSESATRVRVTATPEDVKARLAELGL
jgi:hypothetical protein